MTKSDIYNTLVEINLILEDNKEDGQSMLNDLIHRLRKEIESRSAIKEAV
jgi:hypothetical protein